MSPPPAIDDLNLAVLRRGFRAHVIRRGAAEQLDFLHAQMREAVQRRIFGDKETAKAVHSVVADHLEDLPEDDALRETELMVHLIEADDALRAARVYSNLPHASAALTGATLALVEYISIGSTQNPNPHMKWVSSLLAQPELADRHVALIANRFVFNLNDLMYRSDLSTRELVLEAAQGAQEALAASDPRDAGSMAVCLLKIGNNLEAQGNLSQAIIKYRAALAINKHLVASAPSIGVLHNLAGNYKKIGDVVYAQGDLGQALIEYRTALDIAERLVELDASDVRRLLSMLQTQIGDVAHAQGDREQALIMYQASLAIAEHAGWPHQQAICHMQTGAVLHSQGNLGQALTEYRRRARNICSSRGVRRQQCKLAR